MTALHHRSEQHTAAPKTNRNESEVESANLQFVDQQGSCSLDALARALADFTFIQIFFSVDRLSREGKVIALGHPRRFDYLVSAVISESQRFRPKGSTRSR
jgi:hypothetical protein